VGVWYSFPSLCVGTILATLCVGWWLACWTQSGAVGAPTRNPHLTSPAAGEGLIEGRMEQNPTLTLPILGRGLLMGRMGMDVQSETRREIDSSPRMGEAGRG